ncbi:MAG TPA: cytochrome d ubiquinol oxidase subunit II [Candidatus Solibacter sp.]|nr:cytochrome d ubiquinol oxidase subunit II [Candidatus Solibacter sp.]
MSAAVLDYSVAAILWVAIVVYAVLAGADFGGGVWDLFARGPRAQQQRAAVSRAMGPVWEANHVWLIFLITGLFTAFPAGFKALSLGLFVPFSLVLAGIILRGAAFAFRAHASGGRARQRFGLAFGVGSIITPFLLGACVGAVATGQAIQPAQTTEQLLLPWTTPFSLVCGALALAICAGLAAVYLTVETRSSGLPELAEDFRVRALAAGAATLVLAAVALPLASSTAPALWRGLIGRAAPVTALAAVLAVFAALSMLRRRFRAARAAAAGQVVCILLAWALAQVPQLVPPALTIEGSASPPEVMASLLVTYGVGAAVLLPSLGLLFYVFKGRNPAVL